MKRYHVVGLGIGLLFLTGCAAFKPYLGEDGQIHTQFGDSAGYISTVLNRIGDCIPQYGLILKGLGVVALLTGSIATKVALSQKNRIIKTVVQGVDMASKRYEDLKWNVSNILAFNSELQNKVKHVLDDYKVNTKSNFVKSSIQSLAYFQDTEKRLNREVKRYDVRKNIA